MIEVRYGRPYAEIGRAEGLTRERIRQIVADSLRREADAGGIDPASLQLERLQPALQLAARAIGEGDLRGIDRLLRVLQSIDKYAATVKHLSDGRGGARERLLDKLNRVAGRLLTPLPAEPPPPPAGENSTPGRPSE